MKYKDKYLQEKDAKEYAQQSFENIRKQNVELLEQIERLQEQLADAGKTIDYYDKKDFHYTLADGTVMGKEPAHQYKLKWGVK